MDGADLVAVALSERAQFGKAQRYKTKWSRENDCNGVAFRALTLRGKNNRPTIVLAHSALRRLESRTAPQVRSPALQRQWHANWCSGERALSTLWWSSTALLRKCVRVRQPEFSGRGSGLLRDWDSGSVVDMAKRAVQVSVSGHEYRLVTTLDQPTMDKLAADVELRLQRLAPGQQLHPQALLLVALSLAQELEQAKRQHEELTARSRQMLESLLSRVDGALGSVDENGEPLMRRRGAERHGV